MFQNRETNGEEYLECRYIDIYVLLSAIVIYIYVTLLLVSFIICI